VGVVVDRIHDVVEADVSASRHGSVGTMGTAIIDGRVTDILDLPRIFREGASPPVAAGAAA